MDPSGFRIVLPFVPVNFPERGVVAVVGFIEGVGVGWLFVGPDCAEGKASEDDADNSYLPTKKPAK